MQGVASAAPRASLVARLDHIQFSKSTQTPKQFHVHHYVRTPSHAVHTRNARKRVCRTRAALDDPPRSSKSSPSVIHRIEAPYEVDQDLYVVLALATDEELEDLYSSLYGKPTSVNFLAKQIKIIYRSQNSRSVSN
jgi:hypothetical protein